jgi:hypothetical protein
VVIALAVISLFLRLWNTAALDTSSLPGPELLSEIVWWLVLIPAAVPAYATVGAIVAARRPSNGIGWLLLLGGFVIVVQDAAWQWAARALAVDPGSLPGGVVAAWIGQLFGAGLLPLAPLIGALLLFPSATLPSRWWRLVVWMVGAGVVLVVLASTLGPKLSAGVTKEVPNPLAVSALAPLVAAVDEAGTAVLVLAFLLAVTSVFIRWRRAGGVQRQQLKWLAYTAALGAVAVVLAIASGQVSGLSYLTVLIASVAIASATIGVPAAIGLAILRYRLYDVDLLINRTLVYSVLTATLAAAYAGCVVVMQYAFHFLTGGEPQLAVVASTLAIAALFRPLRSRIQAFIDRRFYRRKYDAKKTLESFGNRLRDETDLDALVNDLVSVVRETMQPSHVSLWLKDGSR